MFFAQLLKAIGAAVQTVLTGGKAATVVNTAASSPAVQISTKVATSTAVNASDAYLKQAAASLTFYPKDIVDTARYMQQRFPRLNIIDPRWLGCQGVVESGDVNKPLLSLSTVKSHMDEDGKSSYGLMQVRTVTALDVYNRPKPPFRDMGYPDIDTLKISTVNIYFSLAVHADNYERYKKNHGGRAPSMQWLIQAYNGGYGNGAGGDTKAGRRVLDYYNKVVTVRNKIWNVI